MTPHNMYGTANARGALPNASGTATAMKNATAVAPSVPSSTSGCVVSAALSAQVNCVQPHHTSQKTRIARPIASSVIPSWSNPTTCVTEKTKTRSKNSSTNVTF